MNKIFLKYKPINRKSEYLASEITELLEKGKIPIYSFGNAITYKIDNQIMGIAFNCAQESKGKYDNFAYYFHKTLSKLEGKGLMIDDFDELSKQIWLYNLNDGEKEYTFGRYMYDKNTSFFYKIMSSKYLFILSMIVSVFCILWGLFSESEIITYVLFSYLAPPIGIFICSAPSFLVKYKFLSFFILTYIFLLVATMLSIYYHSWDNGYLIISDEIYEVRQSITSWTIMLLVLPFMYFFENKCVNFCLSKDVYDLYKKSKSHENYI